VDKSLLVRKQKMLARGRIKKLVAQGKLRPQEFTLAATNKGGKPGTELIYPQFTIPGDENW